MPSQRECGGRVGGVTPDDFLSFQRQMQALEEQICRGINLIARNESEDEGEEKVNVEEEVALNLVEERLFRVISKIGKRPKFEVLTYFGNNNIDELIIWINKLEEYFEYEDIEDSYRAKFENAKLKGHTNIWWQEIQLEKNRRGKDKITRWGWMITN